VKIADKATSDDIAQGTDDSKWVTPKGLKDSNVGYQIGDILTTIRTDLGDKWALCNGASMDRNAFPELSNVMPKIPYPWSSKTISGIYITDSVYANGYWVVSGYGPDDSYGYIAYTTSITSSWTVKQINNSSILHITYQNGYFVATSKGTLLYTTDPSSNWSSVVDQDNYYNFGRIAYGNGYWVYCVEGRYDSNIFYSTNISGPYTSISLWGTSANTAPIRSVRFVNGYFVACGSKVVETNYVPSHQAIIAWSANPAITWTTKTLFTTLTAHNTNGNVMDIAYGRGIYMVVTNRTNSNGATPTVGIYYSSSLNGTWNYKQILQMAGAEGYTILFDGSLFLLMAFSGSGSYNSYAYYTPSITDWISYTIGSGRCYTMSYGPNFYIACPYNIIYYSDQTKLKLPSISTDQSYNYIKVKE